jgi:GNAT superfamily N-acetyltransferase
MDYLVTAASDLQEEQIVCLHSLLINGGRRMSRSYLRWKYVDNPYIEAPAFFVVRYGDQIVALRGLFGTNWVFGRGCEPMIVPHADDLIVHPDHRNRGLFQIINESIVAAAREKGFRQLISLSGSETTQKLCLICGWHCLGELGQAHRNPTLVAESFLSRVRLPQRGRQRVRSIARRFGYVPVKPPSDKLVDDAFRQIVTVTSPRIEVSPEADYAGISSLAESVSSGIFRASRSETFLRWRLRNPQRKYRYVYWRDSRLRGYMILAWTGRNANRVAIADYAAEDQFIYADMLNALVRNQRLELSLMSSTLPDSWVQTANAAGFEPDLTFEKDQRRKFLFYPLVDSSRLQLARECTETYPTQWHISLLDTMAA